MTVYLFDRNKALTGDVQPDTVITHLQTQTLGGQITASVTAVYSQEIEDAFYFGSQDVDNPNVFWLYRITSVRKKDGQIALTGIYIMFDELQGHVIRDVRPQGVTAHVALDRILQGTGWEAGLNFATGTAGASYYYQTALSAFWDFCKVWSVEFKPRLTWADGVITGRYIDIYDQLSDDYGKWYEYGDQLISIEAEQTSSEIVTALIGMGKGEEVGDGFGRKIRFDDIVWSTANGDPVNKPAGQDYVSLPAAVDLYGFREGVVDFPDIEDKGELLTATYTKLLTDSRPKVQFGASALETGMVEIGETVTIVRDDLGIRYKTRVFEVERNFLDKQIKKFKFGDRVITSSAERIKGEKVEQAKQEQRLTDQIAAVFAAITESYWGEDGYNYDLPAGNEYGLPGGIYSFDAPIDQNPSKVIYMGAGKFLIANSKKPDGTWDWRTMADGDGLGADIVTANNIKAGSISSDHIDTDGLRADLIVLSNSKTVEDAVSEWETATITGQYYVSTSPSSLIGGSWSDTAPTPAQMAGKFVWTRTKYVYTDETTYSDPICVTGAKGQDGSDGNDGQDGASGVSTAIVYLYIRDFAPSSPPSSNTTYTFSTGILTGFTAWSQDIPDTTRDPLWMTQATATAPATSPTATIPSSAWSEPVLFVEDGRGIESVQVQFIQHTDGENHPAENSPSWSATPPEWIEGLFIWKRTRVEYKDGSIEYVGYECIDAEIANRLKDELNQHEASIQQVFAQMQVIDGALQTTVTEVGSMKDTQVAMLQTQDEWQVVVETIQAQTGTDSVTVEQVRKYMKFDDDFLKIGKDGSTLEVQITDEAINFLDGGERVAWITGQTLHIGTATIVKNMTVGNHMIEKYEVAGSDEDITIFRWING